MNTLEIAGNKPLPSKGNGITHKKYSDVAMEMNLNDYVKTEDRKTTVGVLRALDRLGRMGRQRTVDGELCVWRIL